MKKLMAILAIVLFAAAAFAAEGWALDSITFQWEQIQSEGQVIDGWKIYGGQTAGGPYELIADVPKVEDATFYQHSVPKGDFTGKWFFVATAYNSQAESGYSNEVSFVFLETPATPINFRLVFEEKAVIE